MRALTVKNLTKTYPKFKLNNISFSVEKGMIVGLVGRNGAGKTTTIKSILGLVCPDSGEIDFFGKSFKENELEIKRKIGYVSCGNNFYLNKTIKKVTDVTKSFYENWNNEAYEKYLKKFDLDDSKKIKELSEGMKIKYLLAIALSHNAEILILDEPTSGLDPVSRDELLDIFLDITENQGVTILYSTHIISDLERCANRIIYVKDGEIRFESEVKELMKQYKMVSGSENDLDKLNKNEIIGLRVHNGEFKGIVNLQYASTLKDECEISSPSLEDVVVYLERD